MIAVGRWRLAIGLLLCGTALLAPAYQMHLHTGVSLHKHIGYGSLFAAPMAGVGLSRLWAQFPYRTGDRLLGCAANVRNKPVPVSLPRLG